MQLITVHNWPRAIAHVDADAFFASVEQAVHPELKGRPVATGAERGIIAAASYEAKRRGVKRGVPIAEAKRICPDCLFLPSDYETYSIFSKRMFSILRRFSPDVEEASIDEAFLDLGGLRRLHRSSYGEIGRKVMDEVQRELGITVSIGVSLTKGLAKLCSKFRKPAGLTVVPGRFIHKFLPDVPVGDVWGIGQNTAALLKKHGINTAYDLAVRPEAFVNGLLGKAGLAIWMELNGRAVFEINTEPKTSYASITKSKTFTPPSGDPDFVLAQALRNMESACIKARRYNLSAGGVVLSLRRSDFTHDSFGARLGRPSSSPLELAGVVKGLFAETFDGRSLYRATGIVLTDISDASQKQLSLFEEPTKVISMERLDDAIDEINGRYGKHTVFISNGLRLAGRHGGTRSKRPLRRENLLPGETGRQRLSIPVIL